MSNPQRYKYLDLGAIRVYQDGDEPGKATGAVIGRLYQVSRKRFTADDAVAIGRIANAGNGYWYASPMLDRSPTESNCPARHIANSRLEAVYWLQGVHDASQTWFQRGIEEALRKEGKL